MASAWIVKRSTPAGSRYIVRYRLGGRETDQVHGGTFKTRREAEQRQRYIAGELAARRVPDLSPLRDVATAVTLRAVAERWQASRIDVSDATRGVHRKALHHVLAAFADSDPATITPGEVGAWIGTLATTHKRGTCEKVLSALRMVLDFADVIPNPARDDRVRLPRTDRREVEPPTAREVEAIIAGAAPRYRLPLLVLEATGMRVGELETLRWGDIDEQAGRWRVARQHEKAGRGRWVSVPPDVFALVHNLVPREDRDPAAAVFGAVTQARLRTDMARTCKAAGIPHYSPHDLRHRRISLWHMQGVPLAQVGQWVGQRNLSVTADTYTHVLVDGEIDRRVAGVRAPVVVSRPPTCAIPGRWWRLRRMTSRPAERRTISMADADPPPSTYVSQLACNHLDWTTVTELPVPIAACEECLKIAEANVGDALPGFHDYFS